MSQYLHPAQESNAGLPNTRQLLTFQVHNLIPILHCYSRLTGVRGGAACWSTALQAGRSRVRFPIESQRFTTWPRPCVTFLDIHTHNIQLIIAFLRQKWLCEHASRLRHTFTACLVNKPTFLLSGTARPIVKLKDHLFSTVHDCVPIYSQLSSISQDRLFNHTRHKPAMSRWQKSILKRTFTKCKRKVVPSRNWGCVHEVTVLWVVDWKLWTDVQAGSTQERGSYSTVGLNPEIRLSRPRSFLTNDFPPNELIRSATWKKILHLKRCTNKYDFFGICSKTQNND